MILNTYILNGKRKGGVYMIQTIKYTVKINGEKTDKYKEKIKEYIDDFMIPLIEKEPYAVFVLDSDNFFARYRKEDLLGKVCVSPTEIVGHVTSITTREDECDIEFEYSNPHKEEYAKKYDLSSLRFFIPMVSENGDKISQPRLLIDENK
jgi:hypothetical protein